MCIIQTLREVLNKAAVLPWNFSVYITDEQQWTLDTPCVILDQDDCEQDEDEPRFAIENSLRYALSVQLLQDIRNNALMQRDRLTAEEFLEAFQFYYENDAFIEW